MPAVRESVMTYLRERALSNAPQSIVDLCDIAYSRWLIGEAPFMPEHSFESLLKLLSEHQLAGTRSDGLPSINVHTTAYALGALSLAAPARDTEIKGFLLSRSWEWQLLLHSESLIPIWPWKFTHHSWRVSHWIGGSVSILANIWRFAPELAKQHSFPTMLQVLGACDGLIDHRSGMLRTYKSEMLQSLFRALYRIRHDPAAGDVGGVVHLHWVNYALGRRPYKANLELGDRAWTLMQKQPFMEAVPYCLDFDIVQIVRTASPKSQLDSKVIDRARLYSSDITQFFCERLDQSYSLHKLPGALATLHECAMIADDDAVLDLGIQPRDIIQKAYWI